MELLPYRMPTPEGIGVATCSAKGVQYAKKMGGMHCLIVW